MSRERFLLAGPPTVLGHVHALLSSDPEVAVLDVTGAEQGPERMVVVMETPRADALAVAVGNRLVVEPDIEIEPL